MHQDATRRHEAPHDVVRGQNRADLRRPDPPAAAHQPAPPLRACRNHDPVCAEAQDIVHLHAAGRIQADTAQFGQLPKAVVAHPPPGRQPRQGRLAGHPPPHHSIRLGQGHAVPPPPQRHRGLQPGRAAADDQHRVIRTAVGHHLGVPKVAAFLHHRRVLRAADRDECVLAAQADIAADAFADVLRAALGDLEGQERVGNRRAGGTDKVENPARDLADHRVRRREPAHAHHRFAGDLLDELHKGFLIPFLRKAHRLAVVRPVRQVDVPQVRQVLQQFHHLGTLAIMGQTIRPQKLFDGKAQRHGAAVADGVLGVFQQFAQQPGPVFKTAAIAVAPVIEPARQKMRGDGQIVAGIDIDNVKSRRPGPLRCRLVVVAKCADVGQVHCAGLHGFSCFDQQARRWADAGQAAAAVGGIQPHMRQLCPRQRAVAMHQIGHPRLSGNVAVAGKTQRRVGRDIGIVRNLDILGADHAPAAHRLHLAHGRDIFGGTIRDAGAMGHLVEPVGGRHGTDAQRLEQHGMAGVCLRRQQRRHWRWLMRHPWHWPEGRHAVRHGSVRNCG